MEFKWGTVPRGCWVPTPIIPHTLPVVCAKTLISVFRKTYHGNKIRKAERSFTMLPLKRCCYSHLCTSSLMVMAFGLGSYWDAYLDFLSCQNDWPASTCRGDSTRSPVTERGKITQWIPHAFPLMQIGLKTESMSCIKLWKVASPNTIPVPGLDVTTLTILCSFQSFDRLGLGWFPFVNLIRFVIT